jgi:hypothetical protein
VIRSSLLLATMGELLVVYDTTAFRPKGGDPDLDHPTLIAIRTQRSTLRYRIAVPQVVIEEVLKHVNGDLRGLANKLTDFTNKLRKKAFTSDEILRSNQVDDALRLFPERLKTRIKKEFDLVLPLPSPSIESLMRRDLDYKRPFARKEGRGLRDYLIWLSILAAKQKFGSRVVFVTENHKDFLVDGRLAPEYVEDLKQIGEPANGVLVVANPEAFVEQYLKPSEKETKALQGKSISDAFGKSIGKAISTELRTILGTAKTGDEWLQYSQVDEDDLDFRATGPVELFFGLALGPIQRALLLNTGERMIDAKATWKAILEDPDGRRPDDPSDYYEGTFGGTIRFLLNDSKDRVSSVRLLEVDEYSVDDISDEGNWALDERANRAEYESNTNPE